MASEGLSYIDSIYQSFVESVPPTRRETANTLAHVLNLAPSPHVQWSEVFRHEVTLAAPSLFAEAMPTLDEPAILAALGAHLCAVIEAFATDRILDGQVTANDQLFALLDDLRGFRDRSLARITVAGTDPAGPYALAEDQTRDAISRERNLFQEGAAASFTTYETIALAKQSVGFPASVTLARYANWTAKQQTIVQKILGDIYVGLQLHDDVVDWEDDIALGGAWAIALAKHFRPQDWTRDATPGVPRGRVYDANVLAEMLRRSERHFRAARRRAALLRLTRLERWIREREQVVSDLCTEESKYAGYTNRAHALSAWLGEVTR